MNAKAPDGLGRGTAGFVLLAFLVATAAVWSLSGVGALRAPNAQIYDLFVSLDYPDAGPVDLLVVEAPHDIPPDAEAWPTLIDELQRFRPAAIAFTFMPENVPARATSSGEEPPLILGRGAWSSPVQPDAWVLAREPDRPEAVALGFGLVVLPPAERGIVRRQLTRVTVEGNGETMPTIEWLAARRALGPALGEPARASYLVDYRGGSDGLPKVSLDQVVSGGLVEELVRDKVILVGQAPEPGTPGVYTPVVGGQPAISALDFHGFALRTLLDGLPLAEPGLLATSVIIILASGAGALVYWRTEPRAVLWWLLLIGGAIVLVSYGVFRFLGLFLPVAEVLAAQVLVALLIWRQRQSLQEIGLRAMLRQISTRLSDRRAPAAPDAAATEIWPQIGRMLEQALDMERAALLEKKPERPELRVAATINCSAEEVAARPRDIRAPPYTFAAAGNPWVVPSDAPSLLAPAPGEEEYLVPLVFAGETLGYWAFIIDAARAHGAEGFHPAVAAFADQIAEMLYLVRVRRRREGRHPVVLGLRWLTAAGRTTERDVQQAFEILGRRLGLFEGVLAGVSNAAAVYDVFGRVRYTNPRMKELASAAGVDVDETTSLDLVVKLAGLPVEQARALMRSVILAGQRVAVASPLELDGRHFLLGLAPAAATPGSGRDTAEECELVQRSVLCELLDVTPVRRLLRLKEGMTRQLDLQLRNDLESMTLAASLLSDRRLPEARHGRVLDMMQAALSRSRERLTNIAAYLDAADQPELLEVYPLDPREPLRTALEGLATEAKRCRIELQLDVPELVQLALGGARELATLATAIVSLLLQDGREGSAVVVRLTEQTETVTIVFSNTGFGLPDGRLTEYLTSPEVASSEDMQIIRAGLRHIEAWRGTLDAQSQLGQGLRFTLRLRKLV